MKISILVFAMLAFFAATARSQQPAPAKTDQKTLNFLSASGVNEFLATRFASKGSAVFGSRDGKYYGMDSDAVIGFGPEGKVALGEFGFAQVGYGGTYTVQGGGTISVELKGYPRKWPPMRMVREGKVVRLYNATGNTGLEMGERGGATETSKMKPFWPFRLTEGSGMPPVSPVSTGGELRSFTSPVLPDDFVWNGDKITFRLDIGLSPAGTVSVEKYWTSDTPSGQFAAKDWRLPAAKCAMKAMNKWTFYPHKSDGKAEPYGEHWEFEITRKDDMARWVVKDDVITVFDNMPRTPKE